MLRTVKDFDAVATALRALDGHTGAWESPYVGLVTQLYRLDVTEDYINLSTTNRENHPQGEYLREITVASLEPSGKLFIIGEGDQDRIETTTGWHLAQPIRAELDAIIDNMTVDFQRKAVS